MLLIIIINKVSEKHLLNLHLLFGTVLLCSIDLLESGNFIEYTTKTRHKRLFKIVEKSDNYYLFQNINYCSCDNFNQRKESNTITCKHVLALKLADIKGIIKVEMLTDVQLTDLLNGQIDNQDVLM